jgi:flavin-dependent dehydrogenase
MSQPWDVAVVGAGAAGAAAAFHLAHAGRSVLLLDQSRFPRRKPCGGGMAASVQRLFPFDLGPAIDQRIERVRFTWCLEDPVIAELPGDAPFLIVQRSRLDAYLAEQAVAAGACFRQEQVVSGLDRHADGLWQLSEGSRARAVVLADGSGRDSFGGGGW